MNNVNGNIEVAPGITVTQEQAEQAFESLSAVNMDEVSIEIIAVKVRHYKLVEILDDNEEPLLNEETGEPLKARKVLTRTAHIQNFVPTPVFHEVLTQQHKMKGAGLEETMKFMDKCVLKIWQISEPWFTAKMLEEGVDLPVKGALFHRFFDPNRLQNLRV